MIYDMRTEMRQILVTASKAYAIQNYHLYIISLVFVSKPGSVKFKADFLYKWASSDMRL